MSIKWEHGTKSASFHDTETKFRRTKTKSGLIISELVKGALYIERKDFVSASNDRDIYVFQMKKKSPGFKTFSIKS